MQKSTFTTVLLCGAVALGLSACSAVDSSNSHTEQAASQQVTVERYLHQPNLGALITPYLNEQGFMDREFPPTVASASPYLTDFYGALATQDVAKAQILTDFVPEFATVNAEGEHSVTLAFKQGFTVEFFPYSDIELVGHTLNYSQALISGETWRDNQANIKAFIGLLEQQELASRYLVDNPSFASEQKVERQLGAVPAEVVEDTNLELFNSNPNAVLLYSEKVHGKDDDAIAVSKILRASSINWLGLEMLNTDQQPILDKYNQSVKGSAEYQQARRQLIDYFAESWNGRAGPKTSGEENYYFQLIELAHQLDVEVIALEHSSMPFLFFRYGETDFGASVRSLWWAERTPTNGRGIVFGGGAHYNREGGINVQDFIKQRDGDRIIVSVQDVTRSWH